MGLAIARRFAREGYNLAVIARSVSQTPQLVDAIATHGGKVEAYAADLTDAGAIVDTFAEIRARQGAPDVLVYNGGVWNEGEPLAQPTDDFHRDMALCVTAAYACARAAAPDMIARGGGSILFTGGGLALNPQYGARVLSLVAGKAGLRGLGLALFEALKPANVHVAQVTIAGAVAAGTAFDPDLIAEAYWTLHAQERAAWTAEIVYSDVAR